MWRVSALAATQSGLSSLVSTGSYQALCRKLDHAAPNAFQPRDAGEAGADFVGDPDDVARETHSTATSWRTVATPELSGDTERADSPCRTVSESEPCLDGLA